MGGVCPCLAGVEKAAAGAGSPEVPKALPVVSAPYTEIPPVVEAKTVPLQSKQAVQPKPADPVPAKAPKAERVPVTATQPVAQPKTSLPQTPEAVRPKPVEPLPAKIPESQAAAAAASLARPGAQANVQPEKRSSADPISPRQKAEKRIDPVDGSAYTFEQLAAYYRGSFQPHQIQAYWDKECKVKGKGKGRGNRR